MKGDQRKRHRKDDDKNIGPLPLELLFSHIFVRVDVKTVGICRIVCKGWNKCIEKDGIFGMEHLDRNKEVSDCLILNKNRAIHILEPFVEHEIRGCTGELFGSVVGLIGIVHGGELIIRNPCLQKSIRISLPSSPILKVGIGFDSLDSQVKAVLITQSRVYLYQFSIAYNNLGLLENDVPLPADFAVVLNERYGRRVPTTIVDGAPYWVTPHTGLGAVNQVRARIMKFEVGLEELRILPDFVSVAYPTIRNHVFVELNDRLSVYIFDPAIYHIDIYRLAEEEGENGWMRIRIVQLVNLRSPRSMLSQPLRHLHAYIYNISGLFQCYAEDGEDGYSIMFEGSTAVHGGVNVVFPHQQTMIQSDVMTVDEDHPPSQGRVRFRMLKMLQDRAARSKISDRNDKSDKDDEPTASGGGGGGKKRTVLQSFGHSRILTNLLIVLLLRLVPIFPFSIMNYLLSVTPVPLGEYTLASWLGMMTITFALVYVGTTLKDLSDVTHGWQEFSKTRWALIVSGLVISVVLMTCVTKVAKSALDKALAENRDIEYVAALPEESSEFDPREDLQQPILVKMNREKLMKIAGAVRTGGKGSVRRKKKAVHKTATTDDKRLQSTLKRIGVNAIPAIEEVNIFKDDEVIQFTSPKGVDNMENLRKLAEQFQKQTPAATQEDDEDEVPELVPGETFEAAAEVIPAQA